MTHRVLGIDPGLASTGWGVVDFQNSRLIHVDHGTITTKAGMDAHLRLLHLERELNGIMEAFGPRSMGIETLYFAKNITSALPVAQARGVILLAAARKGLAVGEFSPSVIKQSVVGAGQADKAQVQSMICLILGLKEAPRPDHAADALAAAVTFINHGSGTMVAYD